MTDLPATPDPLFLAFQTALAGRYSIDREIGRGGMGIVFLAHEVHLDRLVAIKLLPPELSERQALRDRFLREARLAAKLSHPNIIPIHAVDESGGFVYYVMAYVDGETLAQRVETRGPVSASEGVRLIREAAWALGHAHGQGVVHRDVKPDNILIEHATGRAVVADFGIAAVAGEALGDGVAGTPGFMSPEQALGGETDTRSDLYSLGATAFYALCGRMPFEGRDATQILARQATEPAPSLATMDTPVPRKIASLVDRCLSRNPADRPESAQSLAEGLGVALEQRRELPAALRAFVKRNGRMNGGGTLLALNGALLGSIVVASAAGPTAGVLTLLASATFAPLAFGVIAARRLMNQGFAHADLPPAFKSEQESSREERGIHGARKRSLLERAFGSIAGVSASTSAILLAIALAGTDTPLYGTVGMLAAAGFVIAGFATLGRVAVAALRRDVDVEFWSAAWTGRYGALSFSLARKVRGAKGPVRAMTHRATELSLGMAAEGLFESLPKASRDALGDLPTLMESLQRDARALRSRYDELQEGIAHAGGSPTDDDHAAVRSERDSIHERLRETVGALERIRLGLLRLHAGSLTLQGFTTHVGQAADASADMSRLLAASNEVDELLRDTALHDMQDAHLTPA